MTAEIMPNDDMFYRRPHIVTGGPIICEATRGGEGGECSPAAHYHYPKDTGCRYSKKCVDCPMPLSRCPAENSANSY